MKSERRGGLSLERMRSCGEVRPRWSRSWFPVPALVAVCCPLTTNGKRQNTQIAPQNGLTRFRVARRQIWRRERERDRGSGHFIRHPGDSSYRQTFLPCVAQQQQSTNRILLTLKNRMAGLPLSLFHNICCC